jgi:hypothetical protein
MLEPALAPNTRKTSMMMQQSNSSGNLFPTGNNSSSKVTFGSFS